MAKLKPLSTNLMYPLDLQRMDNGTHFMIFHIMSVADIKFNKNANMRTANVGGVVIDKAVKGLQDVTKKASQATTSGILDSAGDALMAGYHTLASGAESVIDTVTHPTDAAKSISAALGKAFAGIAPTKKLKRLDTSIMLYIPQEGVSAKYNMNYSSEDLGVTGALVNSLGNGGNISDFVKSMGNAAPRAIAGGAASVADTLMKGGLPVDFSNTLEAATRTTLNPRKEQLFKGVQNREFGYSHVFTPTTKQECDIVRNIIQTFKLHMHPTLAYDGFYYNYPSEFEIEYHFSGDSNSYLYGITSCALQTMEVHYGSGSSWQTLVNGHPTHVTMRTHFMELQPLTRNLIEQERL